jgi:tetratricopeptide (TPR) repeat protein
MNLRHWLVLFFAVAAGAAAGVRPGIAVAQESSPPAGPYDIELQGLTPEQLNELLARAAAARLEIERNVVASEIANDLLYEKEDKAAALKILHDNPANTQNDNMERIFRAFERADEEFAKAYKLFSAGKFEQALKETRAILDQQSVTYLSAAGHYLYAETLFRLGRYHDAVETYGTIMSIMPDRISFAASSAARCAEAYEQMNRLYYAAEVYVHCINNYALTMSDDELEKIAKRLEYLRGIYVDPLGAVAERMGHVRSRLEKLDSGDKTREKQQEIVAVLEDLIKTLEETRPQADSQSPSDPRQKQGQEKGEGKAAGKARARAARAQGQPVSPAEGGFLPGGIARRPKAPPELGEVDLAGDWAELPPAKRDEIERAVQRALPERYRQLLEEYRKLLSKGSLPQEQ